MMNSTIKIQPGANVPPPPPGAPIQVMPLPEPISNCPVGLEYLTLIDKLMVNQQISLTEVVTGWDTKNKYQILNGTGQQVYFAFEQSDVCERQCCGSYRAFTMSIVDNFSREVMRIERPFKCGCGPCCACIAGCANECTIQAPIGTQVAVVRQIFGCCSSRFLVYDGKGQEIFSINGPNQCSCQYCCNCCADKVFEIAIPSGSVIGCVRKKWRGCIAESVSMADLFSVEFPLDLDVHMKAALLGATFLIDFVEFENPKQNNR